MTIMPFYRSDKIKEKNITEIIDELEKTSEKKPFTAKPLKSQTAIKNPAIINGVVIGKIVSVSEDGKVFVSFHLNPEEHAVNAISVANYSKDDIGADVALMFQNGDSHLPIIIGPVIKDESNKTEDTIQKQPFELVTDNKVITITAENEIILKCGKSSITLTKAGKILIRGKYILSRSSGVNSIKGGSVQIN